MHKKLIGAGQCSDKIAGQFFPLKKMLNTYPPTPTYHGQLGIQTPQVIFCVSIHLCERRALDQQETKKLPSSFFFPFY